MAFKYIFFLSFLVLIVSVLFAFFILREPTYYEKDLRSPQVELKPDEITPVLNNEGKLTMRGWARSSKNFSFDPSNIKPSTSPISLLNKLRYKKWEAMVIIHEDFILGTAVFDVSYAGGYFLHYSSTSDNNHVKAIEHVDAFNKPFIKDDCSRDCLATYAIDSYLKYDQRTLAKNDFLKFTLNTTDIQLNIDLKFNKILTENLVTLSPMSEDSTLFYYNSKRYLIPANGRIVINGKSYSGSKFYLTNDSGRGVWPMRSGWKWVSATGKTTRLNNIALNFGHGFNHPNASKHTEDCFFVDGKLFKLEATKMEKLFDRNGDEEWTFSSEISETIKNKCDVRFNTKKMKKDSNDNWLLKNFIRFDLRHGVLSGRCTTETGEIHEFQNVNGILEDKLSIW